MSIATETYKVICYKCRVCIGPAVPKVVWIICAPCQSILNGEPEYD
jgi:hypothetical protein